MLNQVWINLVKQNYFWRWLCFFVVCKTDSQDVVRIVQVGSMIKKLQDIALDIFLLCLRQQIQLDFLNIFLYFDFVWSDFKC